MSDKPIIFSPPMVLALLAGRKSQTRRIIRKPAALDALAVFDAQFLALPGNRDLLPIAVIPGDRLYVREAWKTAYSLDDRSPKQIGQGAIEAGYAKPWAPILYLADAATRDWPRGEHSPGRYRHARFMPLWASRLTLTVTDVRVQRLGDISRADAIAEGLTLASNAIEEFWRWPPPHDAGLWLSPIAAYASLWNSLHGPDAWARNDWIAAYSFSVEQRNIGASQGARSSGWRSSRTSEAR